MKKLIVLIIFFLCLFSLSAEEASDDYTKGKNFYRADENQASIDAFEKFRASSPDDRRADDALWYLGRLYQRIGESDIAENVFRNVLADEESNRRTEAFYDLVKLLDKLDREDEVIILVPLIYPEFADDSYAVKALPTVLKSYSLVGSRYRRAGLGAYTQELWTEAFKLILLYDELELDEDKAEIPAREKVKFLVKLASLSPNKEEFEELSAAGKTALSEYSDRYPESEETEELLSLIEGLYEPYSDLDINVSVLADYNGMLTKPGIYAEAGIGGDHDLRRNLRLAWDIDYRHNAFDFKTFNFSALKTGDERYFESTDKISGGLSLDVGSKYFLMNSLVVDADLSLAEDQGDFNYGGSFAWDISKSLGRSGIISLDNDISLSIYPDYQNAGREISNIKISAAPSYSHIINTDLSFGIGYGFDYKYYLNAHYDTIDKQIDPDTRRYFIHEASAGLKAAPFKWFELELEYNFTYLDSVNYDLWLYGTPADLFVEDFYDYYKNSVELDLEVDVAFYSGDFTIGYSLRNFINYPARNAAKAFTGELRNDSEIFINMENRFEVFKSDGGPGRIGKLSLALDGFLERQISNHRYEVSYLTDYLNWGVSIGAEWKY